MDAPEDRFDGQAVLDALDPDRAPSDGYSTVAAPLLDALLRTLKRNPARLRALHTFVESFAADEETAALLPEGFDEVWNPIWALAQEQQQQEGRSE